MALQWVVLEYIATVEAIMLVFLTLPGLGILRRGLIAITRNSLKPLLVVVPFCLFLLLDIYWKYDTNMNICENHEHCSDDDHLHHGESMVKMQRDLLLIEGVLLLYWLLFSVTELVARVEGINQHVKKIKKSK